jgi:hypothetical protein
LEWFPYISKTTCFFPLFLDLARLDPYLQIRGLVQFLMCFLQNVLSFTIFVDSEGSLVRKSEGSLVRRSVNPNFLRSVSLVFRPKDRYRTVLNWFNIQSFIKLSKRSKMDLRTIEQSPNKLGFGHLNFHTNNIAFYLTNIKQRIHDHAIQNLNYSIRECSKLEFFQKN